MPQPEIRLRENENRPDDSAKPIRVQRSQRNTTVLTKLLWSALPCAVAGLVLVVGFCGDPLWPAQDMSPEQWRDYHLEKARANRMYLVGAAILLIGSLRFLLRCRSLLAGR